MPVTIEPAYGQATGRLLANHLRHAAVATAL